MHLILAKYAIPPLVVLGMLGVTALFVVAYCIARGTEDKPNTGRKPAPLPYRERWWEGVLVLAVLVIMLLAIDVTTRGSTLGKIQPTLYTQRPALAGSTPEPGEELFVYQHFDGKRTYGVPYWVKFKDKAG